MKLACEEVVPNLGCDYVATGDDVDTVRAAMMAHGAADHTDLMDGKSPEEMEAAKREMDAHIGQLLAGRT
jgi:hypothetical protein